MEWINVKDRLPTNECFGKTFLCAMTVSTYFKEYHLCEWFNPLSEGEENEFDDEVLKPQFIYDNGSIMNTIINKEITHWSEIIELPSV